MSVSSLIAKSTLATPAQLWLFAELFRNDWSGEVSVSREFTTEISHGVSAAEQRYGLRGRPVHSIRVRLMSGGTSQEISALQAICQRLSVARSLWPLFSDEMETSAVLSSGGTSVSCVTTDHRVFAGTRVLIVPTSTSGPFYDKSVPLHVAEVVSVSSSSITIGAGPSTDIPAGSRVFPLIEADLFLDVEGSLETGRTAYVTIDAIETAGKTQIPATQAANTTPTWMQEHDGLPIFDPRDYGLMDGSVRWGFSRKGDRQGVGLGDYLEVFGSRGMYKATLPVAAYTRADAFNLIRFFDSRQGKLYPFWCLSPADEYYSFVGGIGTTVQVSSAGLEIDWGFRPYIYFKKTDGTIYIAEVESATAGSGQVFVLTLAEALPEALTPSNTAQVGVAYLARLNSDQMTESWETTEVMESELSIIELEEEKSVTIDDVEEISTADLAAQFEAGECADVGYLLEVCADDPGEYDILYTQTDLSSYVGEVIQIDGDDRCFEVSVGTLDEDAVSVTVTKNCPDCDKCLALCDCCPEGDPAACCGTGDPAKVFFWDVSEGGIYCEVSAKANSWADAFCLSPFPSPSCDEYADAEGAHLFTVERHIDVSDTIQAAGHVTPPGADTCTIGGSTGDVEIYNSGLVAAVSDDTCCGSEGINVPVLVQHTDRVVVGYQVNVDAEGFHVTFWVDLFINTQSYQIVVEWEYDEGSATGAPVITSEILGSFWGTPVGAPWDVTVFPYPPDGTCPGVRIVFNQEWTENFIGTNTREVLRTDLDVTFLMKGGLKRCDDLPDFCP